MGKKSVKRISAAARASPWQDMRMYVLGTGNSKSKEQKRFERATEGAVKNLAQRVFPLQELADAIRTCLNNMHGPEWHCMVGKDFSVNVRYWRARCFVFEGSEMKVMVFKSAPPAPEAAPSSTQMPLDGEPGAEVTNTPTADRVSIKVLRSEMQLAYQKQVLKMAEVAATAAAESTDNTDDVASTVSTIKALLTESAGPVWHAVGMKGGGEWGCAVAHEEGQLLDFELNGDRFVVWKHAQSVQLTDVFTAKRISSSLFMLTFIFLCVFIKIQSSCDVCCSSKPKARWQSQCEGKTEDCSGDSKRDADRCLFYANVFFYLTSGALMSATALKWTARNPYKHKMT